MMQLMSQELQLDVEPCLNQSRPNPYSQTMLSGAQSSLDDGS